MKYRERLASGVGVLRLAVDACIAVTSMVIAVPVAFIVGRTGQHRAEGAWTSPSTVPPGSTTHDLGTSVTYRNGPEAAACVRQRLRGSWKEMSDADLTTLDSLVQNIAAQVREDCSR
jgi:hypothetical protein